jgi:hypothetical protein
MTGHPSLAPRSSIFTDDEPVLCSHPLQLPDAPPPVFGERECWNFNGVVHKAPT